MSDRRCPKCGEACEVTEAHLSLGLPVQCACGCKFDVIPERVRAAPGRGASETVAAPPPRKRNRFLARLRRALLPVVIVVTLICALWGFTWFIWLMAASLGLTVACLRGRRRWEERDNKSLPFYFYDKCVELLVPLTGVIFFYMVLATVVEGTTNRTTLGRLERLEGFLDSVYSAVNFFKVKPWTAALIIAGLIAFDVLVSYFIISSNTASGYKTYHKWSKRAYTLSFLLCSFTFFGNQVGEQRAHLRVRSDKIRAGYARARGEVEEMVTASVQNELYKKVLGSFPPEVKEALDYPSSLGSETADLRTAVESVEDLGIQDARGAGVLKTYEERIKRTPDFGDQPVRYEAQAPAGETPPGEIKIEETPAAKSAPSNLTVEAVENTLVDLNTKRAAHPRVISLLKLNNLKQLVCQFPKSLTNVAKGAVFKRLLNAFPILEPVVDVFVGTFDKVIEEKVNASVDKVAAAWLENPSKGEMALIAESEKIVKETEVKLRPGAVDKAKGLARRIRNSLEEIRAERLRVNRMKTDAEEAVAERRREAEKESEVSPRPEDIFGGRDEESGSGGYRCVCTCEGSFLWEKTVSSEAECQMLCPTGQPCEE